MAGENANSQTETRRGAFAAARVLLTALLPIAVAFAAVYYFYLSWHSAYLTSRNYRLLATMASQILDRLEAAERAVNTAATWKGRTGSVDGEVGECVTRDRKPGAYLKLLSSTDSSCDQDACLTITSNGAAVSYARPGLHAELNLQQVLGVIIGQTSFDDVIVFEQPSGNAIYQRREALTGEVPNLQALTEVVEDAVASTPGATPAPRRPGATQLSKPLQVEYRGQEYLLFFHPVRVILSKGQATDWVLCGLMQTNRFRQEVGRIPFSWLGTLILFVVLAVLAWPTLNLLYIGPRERLTVRDVRILAGSWIAATGLVTLCIFDVVGHRALSRHFEQTLEALASTIEGRFRAEVTEAHRQIDRLRALYQDGTVAAIAREAPSYPYFSDLLVVGADGRPRDAWIACAPEGPSGEAGPWKIERAVPPDVSLKDRPYFTAAASRQLPTFDSGVKFAMERVRARTTGENVLVLAMPADDSSRPAVIVIGSRLLSMIRPVLPNDTGYAVVDDSGEVVLHSDLKRNGVENFFTECDNDRALKAAVRARHPASLTTGYEGRAHQMYVQPLAGTEWSLVVFRDKSRLASLNLEITAVWAAVFALYLTVLLGAAILAQIAWPAARGAWLWPAPHAALAYVLAGVLVLLLAILLVGATWYEDALGVVALLALVPVMTAGILYLLVAGAGARRRAAWWPMLLLAGSVGVVAVCFTGSYGRLLVAGVATATGLALAAVRRWGGRWQPAGTALRLSFVFLLCCVLAAVASAPSLVIFQDAQAQAVTAFTKHLLQQLGRDLLDRDRVLQKEYRGYEFSDRALQARLRDQRDVYWADPFAEPKAFDELEYIAIADGDDGMVPAPHDLPRHFTAVVYLQMPLVDDRVGVLRRAQFDRASDRSWWWSDDGNGRLRYTQPNPVADARGRTRQRVSLLATLPPQPFPASWRWVAEALLAMCAAAALGIAALSSVVRRLFLLDVDRGAEVEAQAPSRTHTWLYLHPAAAPLETPARAADVAVLDCAAAEKPEEYGRWVEGPEVARATMVVIDRAEARLGDPVWDAARFALLERLTASTGKPVIVLSEIDVAEFFRARASGGAGDATEVAGRWEALLAGCAKRAVTESDWAGPLREVRNRRWWAQCTTDERLALSQLANEGFLNPSNPQMIADLFARGLIRRTPACRLRDESWEQFVRGALPRATALQWEQAEGGTGWMRLRTPLMGLLLLAVVFFITTQRETVNWVVGVATAATMAIPAVMRALELLTRPRAEKADK